MKAMILAAGLGTRLRPLTNDIPKPMVPVAGIPNIERIISHLRDQEIDEIAINLHYCPEPLQRHLGDGRHLGVRLAYFFEPEILGTGGGIKSMLPHMGDETFVVVNGDVLFMPRIKPLLDTHRRSGAIASMVVRNASNAEKLGAVGLNATGRVRRLVWAGDETIQDLYMFTGMHVIEPALYDLLPDNGCIVRKTYIPMVESDGRLFGIPEETYFCDLGTPDNYIDANIQLARGTLSLPGFQPSSDGNIVPESVQLGQNAILQNAVIGERAQIQEGVQVTESVVMPDAVVTSSVTRKIVLADGTEM